MDNTASKAVAEVHPAIIRMAAPTYLTEISSSEARLSQVADWKAQAVKEYQWRRPHEDRAMRVALTEHLQAFTGCTVQFDAILVDLDGQSASVALDSTLFRWGTTGLVMLRPCAFCGSGQFASPSLRSQADLGYAIAIWQPHHPNCQAEDPTNWLEHDL